MELKLDWSLFSGVCFLDLELGEVSFFTRRGGAPENWGDQVLCLRSKGGSKDFFTLKRGDHLHFLKK